MLIRRFFEEVGLIYPEKAAFERQGEHAPAINRFPLPPYRAIFTAGLLFGHANGYHLPCFRRFVEVFARALRDNNKFTAEQKAELFSDGVACTEPTPGFLHRLGGLYLDGMAHTHLYVVLVQAYEEQRRLGAVATDPRLDWKLKTDIVVMSADKVVRVDMGAGSGNLLAERAGREAVTKANAMPSHSPGNPFYEAAPRVVVVRDPAKAEVFRGLSFLPEAAIDEAILRIDEILCVRPAQPLSYADMRDVDMRALRSLHDATRRVP